MVSANSQYLSIELLLRLLLLPGGELQGSARGEIKDIKEQHDVVLAFEVLKAHLVPCARREAKFRGRSADLDSPLGAAHQGQRQQPSGQHAIPYRSHNCSFKKGRQESEFRSQNFSFWLLAPDSWLP